jgi:hypothetical protein
MTAVSLRRSLLAFAIANALNLSGALAQDVTVTPPGGGGFKVQSGNLTVSGLPAATQQVSPVCFDAAR